MPFGSILLALIIGGAMAYLIRFLPIHETFKKVAVVVIVLAVVLYVIDASLALAGDSQAVIE